MTTIDLYRKHKAGEVSREKFLYEVRRDNNLPFITNLTSYDDAIKILKNKGIVNEVDTKEAKADEAVKAEVKAKAPSEKKPKTLHIDVANPYEYRHGLQHELNELGEYTDEALEKAKTTVLKNLAKDANFYSNLLNQDQSSYKFKEPEVYAKGNQAKADGYLKKELKKDEKANVKDNLGKKEEGKVKPKGVKIMPDKGVTGTQKTFKESINDKSTSLIELMASLNLTEDTVEEGAEKSDWTVGEEIVGSEKRYFLYNQETGKRKGTYKSKEEAESNINEHHNDPNFPGGPKIYAMLDTIADDWGKDSDIYNDLEDTIVGWSDRNGELTPKGKIAVKALLSNWDLLDDYGHFLDENIEEIKKKVINKYINVEIEDDGEEFPVLNKKAISDYLKSVIDPSEIKAVNSFMRDEEGFDESASYFFEDIGDTEIVDTTEQEVEDWAKQEMSYYLYSSPDEFPSKELEEEFRPGVDLGASFSKFKGMTDAEDQFEDLMRDYDWYYEMSDDPRVYDRGLEIDQKLKSLVKTVGTDRAVELFNQYAPSDRKVTTSFFMEGKEDKHTKIKEALKSSLKKKVSEDKISDENAKKSAIQTEKAKLIALNKQKQELQADTTKAPAVKTSEKNALDLKIRAATDNLNKLNLGKISVV
jgi:hypothetical protein